MHYNHFTSGIPNSFGRLQKWQVLGLSGNKLLGEMPTSIGNLNRLVQLDLDENKFE